MAESDCDKRWTKVVTVDLSMVNVGTETDIDSRLGSF